MVCSSWSQAARWSSTDGAASAPSTSRPIRAITPSWRRTAWASRSCSPWSRWRSAGSSSAAASSSASSSSCRSRSRAKRSRSARACARASASPFQPCQAERVASRSAAISSPAKRSSQRRCWPGRPSCWVWPWTVRSSSRGRSSSTWLRLTTTPLRRWRLVSRSSWRRQSRLSSSSSSSASSSWRSSQSRTGGARLKLASMRPRSAPRRSRRAPWLPWAPPSRASRASSRIDLPAPVSPVSTVNPAENASSSRSIRAMFSRRRPVSTQASGERSVRGPTVAAVTFV